jgi:hypothetical protein
MLKMKPMSFTFLALFNCCLFAQTLDPYKFFPSAVGNVWEYSRSSKISRYEIVSDSLLPDSSRYLYYAPSSKPVYRIDKNFNIYWWPINDNLNWLYYKLNADSGDSWIVDTHHIVDTFYVYKLAKITAIFDGFFYDRITKFKEITYYQYQPDSILNQYSWAEYTETLAYGIGNIMTWNFEGGPVKILRGCIIEGDTIGIITSVGNINSNMLSFHLFQNYPNPFNSKTIIKYSINEPAKVKLIVYSLLGEEIKVLVNEYKPPGTHSVVFDASDLPSGIYIYSITTGTKTLSKKLILLK